MKEQDLINLNFKREEGDNFYYYTLDIGSLCLITNANDEINNDFWTVELFEHDDFIFEDLQQLKLFITILKNK